MSDSDFRTLDLSEVGTRLEHYNELREVFMLAVEMIKGFHPSHRTPADDDQQNKYQNAVDAIQGRIDLLAKFPSGSGYGSSLQMTIDMIGRNIRQLTEGTNGDDPSSEGTGTQTHS